MSPLQFTVSIISLLSIVHALAALDCNYVVDIWAMDANPPSASPTPEPSRSPSKSPSYSPTSTDPIATDILPTDQDHGVSVKESIVGHSSINILSSIAAATFNYCYVRSGLFPDPWNTFSIKYECDGDNLVRKIYWDSSTCDDHHNDIQIDTYLATETHLATTFVCGQPADCEAAYVRMVNADTMEPTPAPSESPIIQIGTTEEAIKTASENQGGQASNCTNIIGPSANPVIDIEGLNPFGICTSLEDFGAFNASDAEIGSLSWSCVDGQFVFAFYNDTSCSGYSMEIAYTNNSCYGSLWTYVDCYAATNDGDITTEQPTTAPTESSGTSAATTQDVGSTEATAELSSTTEESEVSSTVTDTSTTESDATNTEIEGSTTTEIEGSITDTLLVSVQSSDDETMTSPEPHNNGSDRLWQHVSFYVCVLMFLLSL